MTQQQAEWIAKSRGHRLSRWAESNGIDSACCVVCGKPVAIRKQLQVSDNRGIVDGTALSDPCPGRDEPTTQEEDEE